MRLTKRARRLCGALMLVSLAACGNKEDAPVPAATPVAEPSVATESEEQAEQTSEATTATMVDVFPNEPAESSAASSIGVLPNLEEEKAQVAEELRELGQEMRALQADRNADPARRAAMLEKLGDLSTRLNQISRYEKQAELDSLPQEWRSTHRVVKDGPEAELLVQLGDIDNLGFGWPEGFDPFQGKSTPKHRYPWWPEADDPIGTDRVMVTSGMRDRRRARFDGYATTTSRPSNNPVPLTVEFDLQGVTINSAALQLFVDDFQAPKLGNRFKVELDGRNAPDLAATLNDLEQTGPIGKLVTLQLLPEYLDTLADGKLVIGIDDPDSNVGDGFAFDFLRLLINPKQWQHVGTVRGVALDKATSAPLAGVLVSAANVKQIETGADGRFELPGVPAGLVVTSGSHPDYRSASQQRDLEAGQVVDIVLELQKNADTSEALAAQLEAEGKVDLYGIYFDLDKATLKPRSQRTLEQVLALLQSRPKLHLVVAGHTDSEGSDEYNLTLSQRRAAAVVEWLTEHKIDAGRLQPAGLGETQPVADNSSPAGRALNRRVEIRDASR